MVAARGFTFYELFGGIVSGGAVHARTVVGWGSLSAVEAAATALYADLQVRTLRGDARVAIHPADMARSSQRKAIRRVVSRLLGQMPAFNYRTYLTGRT